MGDDYPPGFSQPVAKHSYLRRNHMVDRRQRWYFFMIIFIYHDDDDGVAALSRHDAMGR